MWIASFFSSNNKHDMKKTLQHKWAYQQLPHSEKLNLFLSHWSKWGYTFRHPSTLHSCISELLNLVWSQTWLDQSHELLSHPFMKDCLKQIYICIYIFHYMISQLNTLLYKNEKVVKAGTIESVRNWGQQK